LKVTVLFLLFALLSGCGGPSTSAQYVDLAGEQFNDEEFANAIDSCSEAIALDPSNADAYMLRAFSYTLLRRYDDGLSDLAEAISLAPNRADLYLYRSQIHAALGQTAKAADDRDRALKLDPNLLSN